MVKLVFRPWAEFGELNSFKVPDQKDYVDRVQVNLVYYQANYMAVVVLLLLLVCFWQPVFILGLGAIIGSAVYLFSVRTAPIVVGEKVLSKREVLLSYGVLSLLVCLIFGGQASLLGLAIAALIILLHSSFRQRSIKSKVNVGFINLFNGQGKNEDGPDDAPAADPENPTPGGPNDDLSRLSGANNDLAASQAKMRADFRSNMRAKYLKKN